MGEKTRLQRYETDDAVHTWDIWTDNDCIYCSYDVSAKKGHIVDAIKEQSTRLLPEIVAKQIFWDRLRGPLLSEITPSLISSFKSAGINANNIEVFGEPELRLSNTLEQGSGLGKLFAALSYDFHHWVLVGFTVVFRVTK